MSYIDDLAYTGAAFHLAEGGSFSNPYCPGFGLMGATDRFYIYVPLHSYVLAGWIIAFGKTRTTLALFQCLLGALASAGLCRFLFGKRPLIVEALAVCLVTVIFLGCSGLRPEALGLFFLSWGSLILRSKTLFGWALACLSLLLTAITCPNYGPLLILIFACDFYLRYRASGLQEIPSHLAVGLLDGVLVVLLFLCMIHFEISQFFMIFERTRESVSGLGESLKEAATNSRVALRVAMQTLLPAVFLLATVIWALLRPACYDFERIRLLAVAVSAGGVFLVGALASSSMGAHLFFYYCMMSVLFLMLQLKRGFRRVGGGVAATLFAFYLLAVGHHSLQLLSIAVSPRPPPQPDLKMAVQALHPMHVYVDNFALNAVYNYQLPNGVTDYHFNFSDVWAPYPDLTRFPKGSVLVLSKESVALMGRSHPDWTFVHMPFPGMARLFPWTSANPYDCVVLQRL